MFPINHPLRAAAAKWRWMERFHSARRGSKMPAMSITTPVSPLRIAVLGVGNIGSTFAFQLARIGGHDVTVVARPGSKRLEQLRRDGAIIDVTGEQASVHVTDALDEQTPFDLVIVTLLAHQVDDVLPALRRSTAGCVQFMFNTFDPERLREAVGQERCAFGMNFVQATLDGDGRLKATIGAGGQKTLMDQERWADLFNASGLPSKVLIDRSPASVFAAVLWSMSRVRSFRELLATGRSECEALVDAMIAAAPRAGASVRVADIAAMKPA